MSNKDALSEDDIALVKKIEENARRIQFEYRGCAQTCLLALQEGLGIEGQSAFKAATGMCAGFGGRGVGLCGALIGAGMAIGIEFGRVAVEEIGAPHTPGASNYSRAYVLCGELFDRFKEELKGEVVCWDIQESVYGRHFDSSDPGVQAEKKTGDYFRRLSIECSHVVGLASKIAAEIILRERTIDAERGKHCFTYNPPASKEECLRLLGRTTSAVTGKELC